MNHSGQSTLGARLCPAAPDLANELLGVLIVQVPDNAPHWHFAQPAHALATLTLVRRGRLFAQATQGLWQPLPGCSAQGPATQALALMAEPGSAWVSLLCRASVLPRLAGLPASEFTDQALPLELFGLPAEGLSPALSPGAVAAQLQARLRLALGRRPPSAGRLRLSAGLSELAALPGAPWHRHRPQGWSERQWQRLCRAELGVTPKFLQRLHRLHASAGQQQAAHLSQADTAAAMGFADQAHMAREYRHLAGLSPGQWREPSTQLAHWPLRLGADALAPRFFAG